MKNKLKKAKTTDRNDIVGLLKQNRLPVEDLEFSKMLFYVLKDEATVIGTAAVETFGDNLLLRSVAIADAWKGQGIGTELVRNILSEYSGKNIYLLTETAAPFFAKLGFEKIDRNEVPEVLQSSSEFSYVCPESAVCMVRVISDKVMK